MALITRVLRPQQFRLLVVQYDQHRLIGQLVEHLRSAYPARPFHQLSGREQESGAVLAFLSEPRQGILLLSHFENWMEDASFLRSLNQRRDKLSRYELGVVVMLPLGGDHLQRFSRAMPDLWSLRNWVAELRAPAENRSEGIFLTDTGRSYVSFADQAEAEAEIQSLAKRIGELQELPDQPNQALLASLRLRLGKIYLQLGQYPTARETLATAEKMARTLGDDATLAAVLTELGEAYHYLGQNDQAMAALEEALRLHRSTGDRAGEGATLNNLSQIYDAKGDYDTALRYLEQSLAIRQQIGDRAGEGTTLNNLSLIYDAKGDYDTALRYLERSLAIQQQIGDRAGEGTTLNNLATTAHAKGDYDLALRYLEQSLAIRQQIGDISGLATTLNNMAVIVFQQQGEPERALPLFLQSYSILAQIGSPATQASENWLSEVAGKIGKDRFNEIAEEIDSSVRIQ